MGQTLTHGVYLPDEGERNCYNGLAGNWQLLDGAVGTVAEHTSQIAGKAPAVHTHTKSEITDFPAYGTTAGTICEGNDSRLSDARTPVAHTHGKADITDLFNSANEWTNTQTYSAGSYGQKILLKNTGLDLSVNGNTGLSDTYQHVISWVDKNNTMYSSIQSWASDANNTLVLRSYYRTDASTSRNLSVRFVNTATNKSVYPETNGDVDFGISSNQWNNLYAKNYYYNGTAWGLDKANEWTNSNTYQGNLYHKSGISTLVKGTNPSSVSYYGAFRHQTYAGDEINLFRGYIGTTGDNCFRWTIAPWVSGSNGRFQMRVSSDGSVRAFEVDGTEVSPYTDNATDLGTSTKRWKTLNGINPGALSLPDLRVSQEIDRTGWVYDGGTTQNVIKLNSDDTTLTRNGWLYVRINNTVAGDILGIRLTKTTDAYPTNLFGETGLGHIDAFVPLVAGYAAKLFSTKAPAYCKFYPCLGNAPSGV